MYNIEKEVRFDSNVTNSPIILLTIVTINKNNVNNFTKNDITLLP